MASSSAIPSDVHGTTPVSACARANLCARLRSIQCRAGVLEQTDGRIVVREKLPDFEPKRPTASEKQSWPESVVIVGGGAAGLVAADVLRRDGYDRPITMLSADDSAPSDRPNLSKDYLAGTAEEDWIPLKSDEFYRENHIDLVLNARVAALDVKARRVKLEDGREHSYGALLLATGAEPVRLNVPGADQPHVHYLRSFADSKAIVAAAASAKRAIVVGASFIGLEVAASLRTRDSRFTLWRRNRFRWNASWAPIWADSFNVCTNRTAWCFTWVARCRGSTDTP